VQETITALKILYTETIQIDVISFVPSIGIDSVRKVFSVSLTFFT